MEANQGTIAWIVMTPVKCHGEDVLLPKGLTGLCLGAQGVKAGEPPETRWVFTEGFCEGDFAQA